MDRPRILDVGCGIGLATLELGNLTNGSVVGIDIDSHALNEFDRRARELGLSHRVKALKCSMLEMDFADGVFDLIWAEGSIWLIGLERGLREWRRLIKPHGFLVVHEMCALEPDPPSQIRDYWKRTYPGIATYEENLKIIPGCGYILLGSFPLPEEAWWELYFGPLTNRMPALRQKYGDDPGALVQLDKEEALIELYRKYSKWYGSAFYVMQKE